MTATRYLTPPEGQHEKGMHEWGGGNGEAYSYSSHAEVELDPSMVDWASQSLSVHGIAYV